MFKRILIAYNGSAEGKSMLVSSSELSGFDQAETHLLAVAGLPTHLYVAEGFIPVELIDDEKKHAQTILDQGIVQLRDRGFSVQGHLAVGDPVEEICRLATQLRCDLIVVGHTRKTKMARWWQRSVGKSLLDNAPCAVLVAVSPI